MNRQILGMLAVLAGCFLAALPTATAVIISPADVVLEEYDASQEVIVTFFNDVLEPVACQLTPDYLSLYLLEYVSFEPAQFVIGPGQQQNVKVTTSFPQRLSPQTHRLVLHAYPGSEETFVLSLRPPGNALPQLQVQDIGMEEDEQTALLTMELRNAGNVVLFATPQVFIRSDEELVRNMTYPQPVVVMPQEVFPLTLRQEKSGLAPGKYLFIVKVVYGFDDQRFMTEEEVRSFVVEEVVVAQERSQWWIIAASIVTLLIIIGGVRWLAPLWLREKHLTQERREVNELRRSVDALSRDIRRFSDEALTWLEQQN